MDFNDIISELKDEITVLFKEKYGELEDEFKTDLALFLETSKTKLERWTLLLAAGNLTLDDYEWLVKSQKDLLALHALEKAGVSKISLGHFKNTLIKTLMEVVMRKL